MQTGKRLRDLFATLLLFCSPAKPERLWNEFREHICDDLGYRLRCSGRQDPHDDEIFDYGLWLIEQVLMKTQRKQLRDFPDMPLPEHNWEGVAENSLIGEQLNYNTNTSEISQKNVWLSSIPNNSTHINRLSHLLKRRLARPFFSMGPVELEKHSFIIQSATQFAVAGGSCYVLHLLGSHHFSSAVDVQRTRCSKFRSRLTQSPPVQFVRKGDLRHLYGVPDSSYGVR